MEILNVFEEIQLPDLSQVDLLPLQPSTPFLLHPLQGKATVIVQISMLTNLDSI